MTKTFLRGFLQPAGHRILFYPLIRLASATTAVLHALILLTRGWNQKVQKSPQKKNHDAQINLKKSGSPQKIRQIFVKNSKNSKKRQIRKIRKNVKKKIRRLKNSPKIKEKKKKTKSPKFHKKKKKTKKKKIRKPEKLKKNQEARKLVQKKKIRKPKNVQKKLGSPKNL